MCLNTFQNTLQILFRKKKYLNQSEFWICKSTTRYSFSSTIKIWKKVKINEVPDTAFLFRAAALFTVICYPLRGTHVLKIQNTNTCCKRYLNTNTLKYMYLNTNTKHSILYFTVFCISTMYDVFLISYKILYIPSLDLTDIYSRLYMPEEFELVTVIPPALLGPKRSKQCSLSEVMYTYLRFCICVTNCDLSADFHCVLWAVCTDIVPTKHPLFHG